MGIKISHATGSKVGQQKKYGIKKNSFALKGNILITAWSMTCGLTG
jgi:hypothetical protein